MARVYQYLELTMKELDGLNRERTIIVMSLSPIEAHGPHLPLGTDLLLAEEIGKQYVDIIKEDFPGYQAVILPTLPLGADALPRLGSIGVSAPNLTRILESFGRELAGMGFKFLLLADNHGGPRHLLACERAARRLYKKHGFHLINPFSREFSLMMAGDREFLEGSGLKAGECGDIEDLHAGTNETSLLLATKEEQVRENFRELPQNEAPEPGKIFVLLAGLFRVIRKEKLAREVNSLGRIAAWAGNGEIPAYIGSPALAKPEAGSAMLECRRNVAREIISQILEGDEVKLHPPLWPLALLARLP